MNTTKEEINIPDHIDLAISANHEILAYIDELNLESERVTKEIFKKVKNAVVVSSYEHSEAVMKKDAYVANKSGIEKITEAKKDVIEKKRKLDEDKIELEYLEQSLSLINQFRNSAMASLKALRP